MPVQSASPTPFHHEQQQEIQQLREQVNALTEQCSQLTTANTAWQAYHQSQVDALTQKLTSHISLPADQPASLDILADQIINQLYQQQQQCQLLEQDTQQLRSGNTTSSQLNSTFLSLSLSHHFISIESSSNIETIHQLNQQLLDLQQQQQQSQTTLIQVLLLSNESLGPSMCCCRTKTTLSRRHQSQKIKKRSIVSEKISSS